METHLIEHKPLTPVEEWELLQRKCKAFLDSGYLPTHIKTVSQALVIASKGHELGLSPLTAFSSISVISGKPCLSAELMLALVYNKLPESKITFITPIEKQNVECAVRMQRPHGEPQEFKFSIDDAKRAGIYRGVWEKYPAALLRARAVSSGCRAVFPDCILGMYVPEELAGAVSVDISPQNTNSTPIVTHENTASTIAQVEQRPAVLPPPAFKIELGVHKGKLLSELNVTQLEDQIHFWSGSKKKTKQIEDYIKLLTKELFERNLSIEDVSEIPQLKPEKMIHHPA